MRSSGSAPSGAVAVKTKGLPLGIYEGLDFKCLQSVNYENNKGIYEVIPIVFENSWFYGREKTRKLKRCQYKVAKKSHKRRGILHLFKVLEEGFLVFMKL